MDLIVRERYLHKISTAFQSLPIVVLIGARQVGKTSIMRTFPVSQYRGTLWLNGQDPDVAALFQHLSTVEQYLKFNLNDDLDGLLMIDEFQYISGISTMLKLLTDTHPHLKVLCSGSSSLDVLRNVHESLAGRVRVVEVLSLSFSEYLLFSNKKLFAMQQSLSDLNDEALVAPLQSAYQAYLVYGGLPRVALCPNPQEKAELINDIYQTYLLNDVRHYVANEHFVGFNKLVRLLAAQIGDMVNVTELCNLSGLDRNACERYLSLLEQMFIIKLIEPYMTNKRKMITKMKKVYFCDLGLRNAIYNSFNEMPYRADKGHIFENEIMLELWRNRSGGENINFYRTVSGSEVDLLLTGPNRRIAVECKYKLMARTAKIAALASVAQSEQMQRNFVANINLQDINNDNNTRYVPGIVADRIK